MLIQAEMFTSTTGATFSECRRYRYRLWRVWGDPRQRCVFVGLNPSTADETQDDPTIRRCIDFSKRWGFGAFDMLNLFGWRSTDPAGLMVPACLGGPEDPVGDGNDAAIVATASAAGRVVMAWGKHQKIRKLLEPRAAEVEALLRTCVPGGSDRDLGTLGRNDNGKGQPKHPLYLPKFTSFIDHQIV